MEDRQLGTIVKFNVARGYGFIRPRAADGDLFFHASELQFDEGEVRPGQEVRFDIATNERGGRSLAVDVDRFPPR